LFQFLQLVICGDKRNQKHIGFSKKHAKTTWVFQ
jgi:hypothetical protein